METYALGAVETGKWEDSYSCTLALTDLSKIDALDKALGEFGKAAAALLKQDMDSYVQLARLAKTAKYMDYEFMVYLYDLMHKVRSIGALTETAARGT